VPDELTARRRKRFTIPSFVYPTVTFVIILAAIQAFVKLDHVKEYLLPLPTKIISTMVSQHSLLLSQGWVTLKEILIGFALSIVVAIPLAVAIVNSRIFEKSVFPLLVTSQVVPKVALAPLFLIWLGYGITPKIILVGLLCFFPIVIDTVAGLRSIEVEKIYLARSMGASSFQQFVKLRLPNALPYVFNGLKLAATFAVIGAVVSELIGASSGLGYLMIEAEGSLNTPVVFAAIGYLTIMGILMFTAVAFVERVSIPWHVSRRGGSH
jgi:NitT/TauT family transport system permease protein